MNLGQRITAIRKFLELTQTQLASIMETTQNIVSLIENGKVKISEKQIECLVEKIHINRFWLENEDGNMFETIPETLLSKDQLDKIVTNASISRKSVPYIDIPIEGNHEDLSNPEYKFMIDYPPLNDCTFYRPVFGESMSPKFKSGDVIACKKTNDNNHIMYGEVYLCIYRDDRAIFETLRTIRKCESNDYVSLVPLNPNFDSIVITKDAIITLYLVKGKIERFF